MSNIIYKTSPRYNTGIYAGLDYNSGGFVVKDKEVTDNVVEVDIVNKDGTLKSRLGLGAWNTTISSIEFELDSTGCTTGSIEFVRDFPGTDVIDLNDRVSIKLFNSPNPFWSGYVENIPMKGTTDIAKYKITLKGHYQRLKKLYLTATYKDMKVSDIMSDVISKLVDLLGTNFSVHSVVDSDYTIKEVRFNHESYSDVFEDLKLFAIDYVAGVDENNTIFFKPRSEDINEEARFWVGQHLTSFQPTRDISKVYNYLYIKKNSASSTDSNYAGEVYDQESINKYGRLEKIVTLPSSYNESDAIKWGQYQLSQMKDEIQSATCKNVKIIYPLSNGDFYIRHLSTYGYANVTDLDGTVYKLPISRIKYKIDKYGVSLSSLTLGSRPYDTVQYFANLDREIRITNLLNDNA